MATKVKTIRPDAKRIFPSASQTAPSSACATSKPREQSSLTFRLSEDVGPVHIECHVQHDGDGNEDGGGLVVAPELDEGVDDGTLEDDE